MRMVLGLLPFGALVAGSASEIVTWVFGSSFEPAAPILAILILGAIAFVMVSVVTVIATASGFPRFVLYFSLPLVLPRGDRKLCLDSPIWRLWSSRGYGGNRRHGVHRGDVPPLGDYAAGRDVVAEPGNKRAGLHGGCHVASCGPPVVGQIGVHRTAIPLAYLALREFTAEENRAGPFVPAVESPACNATSQNVIRYGIARPFIQSSEAENTSVSALRERICRSLPPPNADREFSQKDGVLEYCNQMEPKMSSPHRGIIYIVTGQKFIDEACRSAASVKKCMPDVADNNICGRAH